MITCPVCETDNKSDAVLCECCGERLAAPQPGEEVAPEQQMAAQLRQAPPEPAPAQAAPAPARAGFASIDDEFAGLDQSAGMDDAAARARLIALANEVPKQAAPPQQRQAPPEAPARPQVLYSSQSGKAYYPGSPEYEEGFGPLGEELVEVPPAGLDMNSTIPVGAQLKASDVLEAAAETELLAEVKTQPLTPIAPTAPPAAHPAPAPIAPTPEAPRPSAQAAAKITVYHQRQPVHTHLISTDEVLLGREDVRADIRPDVDLTPWDTQGNVSRKHAYIYRQNRVYTLYAVSNGGVQLNRDLLELGDKRELRDGDVIVLAGVIALKFEKV